MSQDSLRISARRLGDEQTEYRPAESLGLTASEAVLGGTGSLDDPERVEVCMENASARSWTGVIHIGYMFARQEARFWLPGFLYGRNRGEAPLRTDAKFPRLRHGEPECPAAPWWMVRGDQLSHPAAFALADGWLWGVSASPFYVREGGEVLPWRPGMPKTLAQYAGFTCSLERGSIGYTVGYEYAPWQFIQSHKVVERRPLGENCVSIPAGGRLCAGLLLYRFRARGERSIYDVMERVYRVWHEPPRQAGTPERAVADIARAVSRDAWLPERQCYAGFVFERPDSSTYCRELPSQTWTNGLTVAAPLLLSSYALKDEAMREQALSCIDTLTRGSVNPASGLPFASLQDGAWSNRGWWFDGLHTPGHAGYLVGQAVWYLLLAYQAELEHRGVGRPEWLDYVGRVLTVAERQKNSEGEYPYIFSERTGAGLEYDSLGSAWCLAASAFYCWLTGEREWLPELVRSEAHYYESYVSRAECYGGPLDTDKAVDSEGVLALIRAEASLHQITGDARYLDHLRDALGYAFTFQFCCNTPLDVPPLSKVGWSSCGGSITSTANPHIHPMSSTVMAELRYYLSFRPDDYVTQRLRDMSLWSCQTYNQFDGEFDYGKKGWMSERFCYSEGLLTERYPDGSPASTWFALMPWACGCILEGFQRNIPLRNPGCSANQGEAES